MNFKAVKRLTFAHRPPPEAGAGTLSGKQLARRHAMLAEASDILPHLPGPGESLHALMCGRFDLMAVLVVILERVGAGCDHLRIATLSFNCRNVADLEDLLASKRVARVTMLASTFFQKHNPAEYQSARLTLGRFPGSRLAAARTHAKVTCLAFANGQRLIVEASANLRTNGNTEHLTMFNDTALHDWHGSWIDAVVTKHEATCD